MISIESPLNEDSSWIQIDEFTANSISSSNDGAGFLLIDTSGQLRNTYPADGEGVRKLIEHTSMVLPRVKEMDVKLRRE